jgi:enamine deaminase RidA (YjgF/YER057c/UK114 family)
MTLHRLNPAGVHETPGYSHVTVVESGRLAFLAGQCPLDASGVLVGADDVLTQTGQVVTNALAVLAAVGAQPDDVVRSVIYVASDDKAVLASVWHRFQDSELGPAFTSASTLLGVARLGFSGQLVELDLTAALS